MSLRIHLTSQITLLEIHEGEVRARLQSSSERNAIKRTIKSIQKAKKEVIEQLNMVKG